MESSAHFYFNWAKGRIDEMDAVVASLEGKAAQLAADSRVRAEKIIVDLRAKREEFLDSVKKHAGANETSWLQAKAKLENEWNGFQADTKKYVDEFAQQAKQQQSIFEEVAAAQMKAWRQAADKMLAASAELATDQKTKAEAAVQQMKAGASTAEANLQKLAKAGNEFLDGIECGAFGVPRGVRPRQPNRMGQSQARQLRGPEPNRRCGYAFFFTSLTLEKVMASARSLV